MFFYTKVTILATFTILNPRIQKISMMLGAEIGMAEANVSGYITAKMTFPHDLINAMIASDFVREVIQLLVLI